MNNNGVCVSTKTAIIVGIIFAAMVVFGIISRNKNAAYAKEMKNYVEVVVPAALAYGDSMARIADSAKAVAQAAIARSDIQRTKIKKLEKSISILDVQNRALAASALADPLTSPLARAAIIGLQNQVDSLDLAVVQYKQLDIDNKIAITNLTTGFNAQKHRADSLDNIVRGIPEPPGVTHILGIKMPHIPKGIGYIAVAVGGYYVGTQVNK